jgi:glutamate synthase (NADPH/NADH) small chain
MDWTKVLAYGALIYAGFGVINQAYLGWIHSVWVSGYSLAIATVVFGVWRIAAEKLRYVKIRITVLTFLVATWWLLVPVLTRSSFLDFHAIGSPIFFAYLIIVFLFGRRADCGWNCTCVGIRDTAGEPFRRNTLRGETPWRLRYVKWIPLAMILSYLILWGFYPGASFTRQYESVFNQMIAGIFFASLVVMPVTGNRNYCRFFCPWGALYGLVGRFGFFKIEADMKKCNGCGACDRVCEMGIPVSSLIMKSGEVKVSDCVGCGRCVSTCPTNALEFRDVRSYARLGFPAQKAERRLGVFPVVAKSPVE